MAEAGRGDETSYFKFNHRKSQRVSIMMAPLTSLTPVDAVNVVVLAPCPPWLIRS